MKIAETVKIAEIETTDTPHGWRTWLVVYVVAGKYVSIGHDYWASSGGRRQFPRPAKSCTVEHLDELIAALQTARATLKQVAP